MDANYRQAAEYIANADVLLVAAGAGFSADSGLPIYRDIANVRTYAKQGLDYQDLCDPYWLTEDDTLFYGFWGHCLNSYRDTTPHEGYQILHKWRKRLQERRNGQAAKRFQKTFSHMHRTNVFPGTVEKQDVAQSPFFIYTSNVDAHFHHFFDKNEIYELHGNVERWQCAGVTDDPDASAYPPCPLTWEVDPAVRFQVDAETQRASGDVIQRCPKCQGKPRPNILMFRDKTWNQNVDEENAYVAWEAVVEALLEEDPKTKLVVLEIGCGVRVPSVRKECEMVVHDAVFKSSADQAKLIRVNPEFPACYRADLLAQNLVLSIEAKGLEALQAIDNELAKIDA